MKNAHQSMMRQPLHHATPEELLEQYKNLGDSLNYCLATGASIEVLSQFQTQIATVKQELHKKANLKASSTFQRVYYTLFLG